MQMKYRTRNSSSRGIFPGYTEATEDSPLRTTYYPVVVDTYNDSLGTISA